MRAAAPAIEASESFCCFGSTCAVRVIGSGPAGTAEDAVRMAKGRLLSWHGRFSRFDPTSELCWLDSRPGHTVAVSTDMAAFVAAAIDACRLTDGLVDPTLLDQLENAGYRSDLVGGLPLRVALAAAPPPPGPPPGGLALARDRRRGRADGQPAAVGPPRQRRHRQEVVRRPAGRAARRLPGLRR
jgi:hypothetical protein